MIKMAEKTPQPNSAIKPRQNLGPTQIFDNTWAVGFVDDSTEDDRKQLQSNHGERLVEKYSHLA